MRTELGWAAGLEAALAEAGTPSPLLLQLQTHPGLCCTPQLQQFRHQEPPPAHVQFRLSHHKIQFSCGAGTDIVMEGTKPPPSYLNSLTEDSPAAQATILLGHPDPTDKFSIYKSGFSGENTNLLS